VVEIGLVAGYLIAWAVGKAKRAAGRLDGEVDAVMDAGLDRLHGVIAGKLGADLATARLEADAQTSGEVEQRTQDRVRCWRSRMPPPPSLCPRVNSQRCWPNSQPQPPPRCRKVRRGRQRCSRCADRGGKHPEEEILLTPSAPQSSSGREP
jgi:hypothetical protein